MLQDPTSTPVSATNIHGWRTNASDAAPIPPATLAFLVAPGSGQVGVASDAFAVSANGNTQGDVVITPYVVSGGSGSFSPTSVTINSASTTYAEFTFTPSSVAEYSIGITNNRGLTNPAPRPYSSQASPPAPLDMSNSWLSDIHPKRPLNVIQGYIPSGVAGKSGLENKVSAHTEYAQGTSTSVVSRLLGTSYADVSATAWTRGDNVGGYKPLEIITDPDNASRSAYSQQVSQAGGGWDATHNKKMRSTLGFRGTTVALPLGTHAWIIHAVRIPAYWKSITPPKSSSDWCVMMDYHCNGGAIITGKAHATTGWKGGGESTPSAAQLFLGINWWNAATAKVESEDKILLSDPPADTWIYVALEYSLWHGYTDPSIDTSGLTTANAFIRPYVAIGNGPMVQKDGREGQYWGIPYTPGSTNWAYPGYWQQQMYFWPTFTPASAGTDRGMLFLGTQEYRVSDNPDPTGHPTITAQDILAAFKASRLVTPP